MSGFFGQSRSSSSAAVALDADFAERLADQILAIGSPRRPHAASPGQTWSVARALAEIDRESLWQKIESGNKLVLVDALSPISFAASHLPGAINIPPQSVDELVERRIPDRDMEVVVYCANPSCESSVEVAERLIELGYRNVRHYAGGKQEWREAGLPLEGGRV